MSKLSPKKTLQRTAAPLSIRSLRETLLSIVVAERVFPAALVELELSPT
jgi:hypothetical protein